MTLVVGYVEMQDSNPGLPATQRVKGIHDAQALGIGPRHAVREGESVALCNTPVTATDEPWPPPAFKETCRACLKEAPRAEEGAPHA